MKYKYLLGSFVIAVVVFTFSSVSAEDSQGVANSDVITGIKINADTKASNENAKKVDEINKEITKTINELNKVNAIKNTEINKENNQKLNELNRENTKRANEVSKENSTSTRENEDKNSTTTESKGKFESETHRSVVATFVKSLLSVADREGGIGKQVREIAQKQNDSASTTADAVNKVDEKGAFRTFFFGSDYKNLNVIKNELATTTENINQLKNILASTTNATDTVALNTQIKVLETEQTKLSDYVSNHENSFSLFGWFTKLFNK